MFATSIGGGAIWWTLTRCGQVWCLLQVKLCDPCLSALEWFVYHSRRYTSAQLSIDPHVLIQIKWMNEWLNEWMNEWFYSAENIRNVSMCIMIETAVSVTREISWATEFKLFRQKLPSFSKYSLQHIYLFGSLVPATRLKSNHTETNSNTRKVLESPGN